MTSLNSQQKKNLEAFVIALGQQSESLPTGLQQQLHAIGQNLENRVMELQAIAASLPELNRAYQEALADTQTIQEEDGQMATFVASTKPTRSSRLQERAVEILTAPDPVQAAQKNMPQVLDRVASNPLKRLFRRG